ncbi:hypothetical protein AX15_001511 [Amanita polypyramis BW_CC]|nr:hypothetical protein AX15_001511 [Amanita polypyramis BW_CC]
MQAEGSMWKRMTFSLRALAYGLVFFLTFALACSELGLVSQQLHQHGNSYALYPTMQYKHAIGLLLFSAITTMVVCLSHFWLSVGFFPILSIILAVFWGVGAGLLRSGTPFRGTSCGRPVSSYPAAFQPYANLCSRIVTIEALAWTEWGLSILLLVGSLAHKLHISVKSTPEELYFATPEKGKV